MSVFLPPHALSLSPPCTPLPLTAQSAAIRPRFSSVSVSVNLDTVRTAIVDSTRSFDPHECSKHVWRDATIRILGYTVSKGPNKMSDALKPSSAGTPSFTSCATSFEAREEEAQSARVQDVEEAWLRVRLKGISWRLPAQATSVEPDENATTPGGLCLAQFGR
ncbi:hypothetical protein DFH09DRAFT_1214181 [Mycena vulgaris]|nr:hypothetical protein DFH09DRAFT_1214181 [Mycena vulgaris]